MTEDMEEKIRFDLNEIVKKNKRNKEICKLLKNKSVRDFVTLTNINLSEFKIMSNKEIVLKIQKRYENMIDPTLNLFVYIETISTCISYKLYRNIEDGNLTWIPYDETKSFCKNNDVLYFGNDKEKNEAKFKEARNEFFTNLIYMNQEKAKTKILKKYKK